MCGDAFEQFFDEESEEWHLKNALRVDGKVKMTVVANLSLWIIFFCLFNKYVPISLCILLIDF